MIRLHQGAILFFSSPAFQYALPFSELEAKVAKPKVSRRYRAQCRIGEHIRLKRIERGMTEAEVAILLDVKPKVIVLWENGTRVPQLRRNGKIKEFLGYDPYGVAPAI